MSALAAAQRAETTLRGARLAIARVACAALALFGVGSFALRVPGYVADLQRVCNAPICAYGQVSPEAAQSLQALGLTLGGYAATRLGLTVVVALTWFAVAVVLAWRRSHDGLALLVAVWFVFDGAATITGAYGLGQGATTQGRELAARAVNYLAEFGTFALVFSLFPTRRYLPRLAFWLVVACGFFVAGPLPRQNALAVPLQLATLAGLALAQVPHVGFRRGTAQQPRARWSAVAAMLVAGVAAVLLVTAPSGGSLAAMVFYGAVTLLSVLQLARYWHVASQIERQRTKWAVFGLSLFTALAAALLAPVLFMPSLGLRGSLYQTIHTMLLIVASAGLPFAITFSILRYRLWDIDVLINKALVYGSLTGLLVATYAALIVGMESLVVAITGQASQSAVIVVATLAIAALFRPARQRIQRSIDRRFYRRKYDTARTIATFAVTLRGEMDLGELRERLIAVVDETMQPAHVSLWLRPSPALQSRMLTR